MTTHKLILPILFALCFSGCVSPLGAPPAPNSIDCDRMRSPTHGTVAIEILVDKSRSMSEGQKLAVAMESVRQTIAQLRDTDFAGLVGFDRSPFVIVRLDQLSRARARIIERLPRLFPASNTDLFPALEYAEQQLSGIAANRKHIIVISDGRIPPHDPHPYALLAKRLNQNGISVSIFQFGEESSTVIDQFLPLVCGQRYQGPEARMVNSVLADLKQHVRHPGY